MIKEQAIAALLILFGASAAESQMKSVEMHAVTADGVGASIGTIELSDMSGGLHIVPKLRNLPPGEHGFHVHENADCAPAEKDGKMQAALKAGAHLDPAHSAMHQGPQGQGHLGDLPKLEVATDGTATKPVMAARLKVADLKNHALIIHAGSDNYSDTPQPLGGGGARIACGVIAE